MDDLGCLVAVDEVRLSCFSIAVMWSGCVPTEWLTGVGKAANAHHDARNAGHRSVSGISVLLCFPRREDCGVAAAGAKSKSGRSLALVIWARWETRR